MNNEIKEILDKLKEEIDLKPLWYNERIKLLDYITNLQEEIQKKEAYIKYLQERTPIKAKAFYVDAREELQERIDKAIKDLNIFQEKLMRELKIGIPIREISDIQNNLRDKN